MKFLNRVTMGMGLLGLLLTACSGRKPLNLGARDGLLPPCPSSPNCVASQAVNPRQRIEPFHFTGDAGHAFSRLRALLAARRDTTVVEESNRYLRVEFRTRLGFIDDGEFLLDPERYCIHLRSAARIGYSDLGKNRDRLEELRKRFSGQ